MKYSYAKRIVIASLLGCVVFSLLNFMDVKEAEVPRLTGINEPEGDQRMLHVPLGVLKRRHEEPRMKESHFEDRFMGDERFDKYFRSIRKTFPNFSFSDENHVKPRPLQSTDKSFSSVTNKSSVKHRRKRLQRYLVEYSPFQNNEQLRDKVLVVRNSSAVNGRVWFHRTTHADGTTEYDDGVVDQLGFVPPSYASKLHRLGLVESDDDENGFVENKPKLDKYLKKQSRILKRSRADDLDSLVNASMDFSDYQLEQSGPDWTSLLKVIYLPEGLPSRDLIDRDTLSHENCLVSACHVTDDPTYRDTSHARVFQNIPVSSSDKPTGQIWVLWLLESPVNTFIINDLDMKVNWSATFRRDSTIVTPYAKYLPNDASGRSQEKNSRRSTKKNYATGKTKMVAWFASNCFTTNGRMDVVQELNKHIDVDVYGKCGSLECLKHRKEECYEMLAADYKFYLAFENSNCDSYITEKLFENALSNDVVPVVMGARREDYEKSAPPNSFIHVEDFKSIKELGRYLLHVANNDTLYNSYLDWKGHGRFIDTKFWCRLCAMLHDDDKPHLWYADVESWWKHHATCRTGRWSLPDGRQKIWNGS